MDPVRSDLDKARMSGWMLSYKAFRITEAEPPVVRSNKSTSSSSPNKTL